MLYSDYYYQKFNKALFFFKGRVALYALLKALGIKEGDEIIIQAFTCLAVPNPIIWLGAKPVFVDIDPNTFNIDPSKIEEKITKKTKAIIVQHTFGVPAEIDKIREIAKRHNLYLIEDACHAIGSKYKGQLVGFLGDASFFSFGWGKPIVAGVGGCAIINNLEIENEMKKIYEKIRECSLKESIWLRIQYLAYSLLLTPSLFWFIRGAYRFLSKMKIIGSTFLEDELESKMPVEYIKKMPKIQKEVLMKELKRLDSLIDYRKRMVSEYKKMLSEIGIKTQKIPEYIEPVYLRYPILVNDKNRVVEEAQKNKIEIGDWYNTPVHPLIGENLKKIGYCLGSCQVAEDVAKKIITLPVYEKVKEKDMKRTIEFLSKHKEKIIKNY
jgi:dTDP-4-amino-4,6-dideoxygalactose transaminase